MGRSSSFSLAPHWRDKPVCLPSLEAKVPESVNRLNDHGTCLVRSKKRRQANRTPCPVKTISSPNRVRQNSYPSSLLHVVAFSKRHHDDHDNHNQKHGPNPDSYRQRRKRAAIFWRRCRCRRGRGWRRRRRSDLTLREVQSAKGVGFVRLNRQGSLIITDRFLPLAHQRIGVAPFVDRLEII